MPSTGRSRRDLGTALSRALRRGHVRPPRFDDDALARLRPSPALRILRDRERRIDYTRASATTSASSAACSSRSGTPRGDDREPCRSSPARSPRPHWDDLLFAWRVCKHVSSNAIVLAKGMATIGIGAGQMSRVDSVRIAIEKAQASVTIPPAAVLAGDAFFPFADGPELALDAGGRRSRAAGRLEAGRRGRRCRRKGGRGYGSSPAGGTSGTERRLAPLRCLGDSPPLNPSRQPRTEGSTCSGESAVVVRSASWQSRPRSPRLPPESRTRRSPTVTACSRPAS